MSRFAAAPTPCWRAAGRAIRHCCCPYSIGIVPKMLTLRKDHVHSTAAVDVAVNILFTLEMVLMVVAAGGLIEYLRWLLPWNGQHLLASLLLWLPFHV